jgi:hypothetical protein
MQSRTATPLHSLGGHVIAAHPTIPLTSEQSGRLRNVVRAVLALSQRSLLELVETGYLPEDFVYSTAARFFQRRSASPEGSATIPERVAHLLALPIAQLSSARTFCAGRPFSPREFVDFVLHGDVDQNSALCELASCDVFQHTASTLPEYGRLCKELESSSNRLVVIADDITHLFATDDTAGPVWKHLTRHARRPGHAYRLAVRRFRTWIDNTDLQLPERHQRVSLLITATALAKALGASGAYRFDREQRDILLETLRDRATTHGMHVGILNDHPGGSAHWLRPRLDRFDSIKIFDERVVIRRTRPDLCRIVLGLRSDPLTKQVVQNELRLAAEAGEATVFPAGDTDALAKYVQQHLSYSTPLCD